MADVAVALSGFTSTSGALVSAASSAGTSIVTGNTAVIAAVGNTRQLAILVEGSAASTLTFEAGDEPPAETSGLGNSDAITIASGEEYLLMVPAGRFVQSNGTVRVLCGGTGPVLVTALTIPRTV